MGRDTVMTPELLEKLERAFSNSFTDEEACLYVGIDTQTLYNYCKKNPDFSSKKEALKKKPNLKAKMVLLKGLNSNDINISLPTAKYWADRKMKDEFSLRTENTGRDGKDLPSSVVVIKDNIKRSKPKKGKVEGL